MATARENLKIYVVDDDPIISSTLTLILQHHGFDAIAFTQPMEALKAAKLQPPCLVISDVVMPVLTGIQLAGILKRYCPATKILLFSGEPPPGNQFQIAGEEGHTFEFLSKPLHPIEFVKRIRAVIDEILLTTEDPNLAAAPA